MKKENGRTAQPGNGAELRMAGMIHLALSPEEIQQIAAGERTEIEIEGMELVLQLEPAKKNRFIELTPWFEMDDAVLTIDNTLCKDDSLTGYFGLALKESEKRQVEIVVNEKQAKAIGRILMNYAHARESFKALSAEPIRV